MPTCGWILETARDRYAEGVERFARAFAAPAPPPVYACPYCDKKFASEEARRKHLGLDHPLDLPILEVAGVPLPTRTVFRHTLLEADVNIHLATQCRIRKVGAAWEPLDTGGVAKRLASLGDSSWVLELVNERAIDKSTTNHRYEICIRVPTEDELDRADAAFVKSLAVDTLSHEAVQEFSKQLPTRAAPREYAAALGDYAIALLLKEQRRPPRAPVGFHEFAAKMRSSLDVLRHFSRPVALAVCSSIRFNLNEFKRHDRPPQCDAEIGEAFFAGVARGNGAGVHVSGLKGAIDPICPVDAMTDRLLRTIHRIVGGETLAADELLDLSVSDAPGMPISEQDLVKINVMCAWSHLQHGRAQDALKYLQAVRFNSEFGKWAEHNLERLFPDDK